MPPSSSKSLTQITTPLGKKVYTFGAIFVDSCPKIGEKHEKTATFYFCKRLVCKILACFGKCMTLDEELAVI